MKIWIMVSTQFNPPLNLINHRLDGASNSCVIVINKCVMKALPLTGSKQESCSLTIHSTVFGWWVQQSHYTHCVSSTGLNSMLPHTAPWDIFQMWRRDVLQKAFLLPQSRSKHIETEIKLPPFGNWQFHIYFLNENICSSIQNSPPFLSWSRTNNTPSIHGNLFPFVLSTIGNHWFRC